MLSARLRSLAQRLVRFVRFGWVEDLARVQRERPWLSLALVAAVTAVFAVFASRLTLDTRYQALLPDSQPSAKELRRVEGRTAIAQTVLVLLEGGDRSRLRAMGDTLVPSIVRLGPETVSAAEDGPHETRKFFAERAGLFLSVAELEKLKSDVDDRWDYEVAKKSGNLLDDSDPPPPLTAGALKGRFEPKHGGSEVDRYPDGYYEREGGLVVVVRSPIAGGDLPKIRRALARIHASVAEVKNSRPDFAAIRVSYAGDMPTGLAEYGVVRDDLLSVGATGLALVLGAVLLYFLRVRALIVMAISIFAGLVWTFGLTQMAIGHLNVASAFLISIVAGNAINVGILYQSRYFEERRGGAGPHAALSVALVSTWRPTVIAAGASAASYGSLLVTDFRAFRDFGFIAASGMILCWVVQTFTVLPMLVLLDRNAVEKARRLGRFEMAYGRPFAWLVPKAPMAWVVAGIFIAVLGIGSALRYALSDPMEYDMRKVQNDPSSTADLQRAWAECNAILGASQGGMVVLANTADQARELEDSLKARWDAAPVDEKPFVSVRSLWTFVPKEQNAKVSTLAALGERLTRAHDRGFVGEEDWRTIREVVPPKDLAPFGIADLPSEVARPFTEKDGTRGTLVFVEAEPAASDDLHYLIRYADSFRETHLPSGAVVRGSGHAVIFADMLKAAARDIPRAISLSLAMTLAAVFAAFRKRKQSWPVLFALLVGSGGVGIFLYLAHVRLNFLNFAALPITFGIGVDYAVNVAQRHYADRRGDILATLRTSGGAVVLCSLTTMLGYLALLGSHNQAIRSLGEIAVVGEVSCLLAAMVVLPALLLAGRRPVGENASRMEGVGSRIAT
jgi:predicted RND superfamily exporter protein